MGYMEPQEVGDVFRVTENAFGVTTGWQAGWAIGRLDKQSPAY